MASSSSTTGSLRQLPSLSIPPSDIIPAKPAAVPGEVDYLTDLTDWEQRNATLQAHWNACMSGAQKTPSIHKDVFVLLLSWAPACDDMSVAGEVKSVGDLFEDMYHYKVSRFLIDSSKKAKPQAQVNKAVADFVEGFDGPDSLFIIYYAGHGDRGKAHGELKLSARRRRRNQQESEWDHIVWNRTEHILKDTQSDVLVIFDCCYANDLGRGGPLNPRSFEYLAASSEPVTRSPGPTSFTSALIWALKKLATPDPQLPVPPSQTVPIFTTSKLAAMICNAPQFPPGQKPSLNDRGTETYQRIVLSPLPELCMRDNTSSSAKVEDNPGGTWPTDPTDCLTLELSFREMQDEATIKKLADHFTKFMKFDNTSLCRVRWEGISPFRPADQLRKAVHLVMKRKRGASNLSHSESKTDRLSPRISLEAPNGMVTPLSLTDTILRSPIESAPPTPTENMPLLPQHPQRSQSVDCRKKGFISRSVSFVRRIIYAETYTADQGRVAQGKGFASFWSGILGFLRRGLSLRSR
ncbi:uncharacterized protein BP5553_09477 [Venustampulla echinocandica]|uniref:Peptidase C14 caspase domain-containing protein n=1 Tax=Venustampulla echinocandica TaxID=2656787 RepID=A0A370TCW7_9HELO|nr:uncharacterized protein BP5553_09477 [Venustampulla echinocandica]RDL32075.1 hypothetical protein BP5553_09477 [Venustampulla echinocandica]